MDRDHVSEEEFREYLGSFFGWTSSRGQRLESWLLSLETWARGEYDREASQRRLRENPPGGEKC